MMDVANEALKRLAFLEVLELIAAGDDAALEQAGLSKETIARIRKAGAKDVPVLSKMLNLVVSVDPRSLNMNFSRAELAQDEQRALEYFVANHATPAMIKRFFKGVPEAGIRMMRTKLGVRSKGRSPTLDHKTAAQVFDAWAGLAKSNSDERKRYIDLHKDFPEWPLSALYSAINEADMDSK